MMTPTLEYTKLNSLKNHRFDVISDHKNHLLCSPNFNSLKYRGSCHDSNYPDQRPPNVTKPEIISTDRINLFKNFECNHKFKKKEDNEYHSSIFSDQCDNLCNEVDDDFIFDDKYENFSSRPPKWKASYDELKKNLMLAKNDFLNWIYPFNGDEINLFEDMPPCIPLEVFCNCNKSTSIYHVPHIKCNYCGQLLDFCSDCQGYLKLCTSCGKSPTFTCNMYPNFICNLQNKLCHNSLKSQPIPELIITTRGPFMREYSNQKLCCSNCFLCKRIGSVLCDSVSKCAYNLGTAVPCCKREAPPAPLPPRVIQRLIPSFFQLQKKKKNTLLDMCLKKKKKTHIHNIGILGIFEDVSFILSESLASSVEKISGIIGSSDDSGVSQLSHCSCSPPLKRYPKSGFYDDITDPPTKYTGCKLIDALNTFMDSLVTNPVDINDIPITHKVDIETEKTGNVIIDTMNSILDDFASEPFEITPTVHSSKPVKVFSNLISDRPKELPHLSSFFSSIVPSVIKSGHSSAYAKIQKFLSNPFGTRMYGGVLGREYVDYVDFNITPKHLPSTRMTNNYVSDNQTYCSLVPERS